MKPKIQWDTEEECWVAKHGNLIVRFYEENQASVSGHLLTMEIYRDSITEEQGILFKSE